MDAVFLENGHVASPRGWKASVAACKIKYTGRNDLALLVSDSPCTVAALFTTNKIKSAHIHYDKSVLAHNTDALRAVLINTGSANACTGQVGIDIAAETARIVEDALGFSDNSVLVMSTGVIGALLSVEKVSNGVRETVQRLSPDLGPAAAQAIMTTDTRPKFAAVRVDLPSGTAVTIGGMAKGAGMIHPNMGTMLSCITTDAAVTHKALDKMLRDVAHHSFNCISVDGDTSTNDTVLALANGLADNKTIKDPASADGKAFCAGMLMLSQYLAREIARDGEGATRLVTVIIKGANSYADAYQAATTVARSPLVKTALNGADPNWGRVVCAIGYSGLDIDPGQLVLYFGGIKVFENNVPLDFDEQAAHEMLSKPEVEIVADLGMGREEATVWTCDFSCDYVRINADYRT